MNLVRSLRALPRPVWIAFVATLVNRSGTMALPFLVVYLTEARKYDPETAGLTLGIYGAGALVAGPASGWLVARIGARAVMVASLVGTAAALLVVPLISSLSLLGFVVFGWALVGEAFRPACAAVVAEHVAPQERRQAYAVLRFAVNLGMTIGPAIGGFLAMRSFYALFVIDAVTSLAAAVWLSLPAGAALAARSRLTGGRPALPDGVGGLLLRHLIAVTMVAMVAYQGMSTMALYMVRDLHLQPSDYGLAYALNGLLIIAFEVPLTAVIQKWPHRPLLVVGTALTGAGFAALAAVDTLGGVLLVTVVYSVGEMILGPAAAARVADLEPPTSRGIFVGLYNAVWSAAFALGPWVGTQSLAHFGALRHWLVVGAVGILGAIVFASGPDAPPQRGRAQS